MSDEQKAKAEEVEGQGVRYQTDEPEASDSDAEVTENATEGADTQVEGQPLKWGEPAKDVEGQGFRAGDKADRAAKPESGKDEDDPEVKGQGIKWGEPAKE